MRGLLDTIRESVSKGVTKNKYVSIDLYRQDSFDDMVDRLNHSNLSTIDRSDGYMIVSTSAVNSGKETIRDISEQGLEPGTYWFAGIYGDAIHFIVIDSGIRHCNVISFSFSNGKLEYITIVDIPSKKVNIYRGAARLDVGIEKTIELIETH